MSNSASSQGFGPVVPEDLIEPLSWHWRTETAPNPTPPPERGRAEPPNRPDRHQCTALMYAVSGTRHELVLELCTQGDLDARDATGKSALHYALLAGNQRAAIHLVKRGANVNLQDNAGRSPLMLAALCGYFAIVQALLAHGADLSLKDQRGRDTRTYAAAGRSADIITLLPLP